MQRVELVEESDERAADAPAEPADPAEQEGAPGPSRPARSPRRTWPWVAVVALTVVALVTVQGLLSAHARHVDARIAAVTGLVGRVDQTVAPTWTMSDAQRRFVSSAVRFGDEAIGVATADDGSRAVVAFDAATGRTSWRHRLSGPDQLRARAGADVVQPGSCTAVPGSGLRVACFVTDGVTVQTGGELSLTLRQTTAGHVVVLDADGRVLADRATSAARSFAATSNLLLLAGLGTGARGLVTAQDLLSGREVWEWSTSGTVVGAGGLGVRLAFQPFAVGDDVAVAEPSGHVTVLDRLGRVVHAPVSGVTAWALAGDALVLTAGDVEGAGTILVRPGVADVALPGAPVRLAADDGTLPQLALTVVDDTLHAYDATTGAPRWQAHVVPRSRVIVLQGRLYLIGGSSFVVLDGRTGSRVASVAPAPGTALTAPVSDGRHVFVAQVGGGASTAWLVAYGLTGRPAWTVKLPTGTTTVQQLGRTLVAYDDEGLEVLASRS
jgi:outer membrane protein assembly factor BamB